MAGGRPRSGSTGQRRFRSSRRETSPSRARTIARWRPLPWLRPAVRAGARDPGTRAMHLRYGGIFFEIRLSRRVQRRFTFDVPSVTAGHVPESVVAVTISPRHARCTMIETTVSAVWRVLRKNPYLRRGLPRAGFSGGWSFPVRSAGPSSGNIVALSRCPRRGLFCVPLRPDRARFLAMAAMRVAPSCAGFELSHPESGHGATGAVDRRPTRTAHAFAGARPPICRRIRGSPISSRGTPWHHWDRDIAVSPTSPRLLLRRICYTNGSRKISGSVVLDRDGVRPSRSPRDAGSRTAGIVGECGDGWRIRPTRSDRQRFSSPQRVRPLVSLPPGTNAPARDGRWGNFGRPAFARAWRSRRDVPARLGADSRVRARLACGRFGGAARFASTCRAPLTRRVRRRLPADQQDTDTSPLRADGPAPRSRGARSSWSSALPSPAAVGPHRFLSRRPCSALSCPHRLPSPPSTTWADPRSR